MKINMPSTKIIVFETMGTLGIMKDDISTANQLKLFRLINIWVCK